MRSESGVSLVSGALQSSLARAQRNNYPFHNGTPHNNSEQGKEALRSKKEDKHLSAYCNSVGSNFASYSADQFLELGNSLNFDDGGFLQRSIPEDIQNDCVILKQQVVSSSSNNVSKKKKRVVNFPADSPTPSLLNGITSSTPLKQQKVINNNKGKDSSPVLTPTTTAKKIQENCGETPKKFDNLIQKLLKLLKDKTIGKNKRKRLTKKLRQLEKRKSETVLNNSSPSTKNNNSVNNSSSTKSPIVIKPKIANGLDGHSNIVVNKLKTKMGPDNYKNGVVTQKLTNGTTTNANTNTTTTTAGCNNLQLLEPKRILYPKEKIVLGWRSKRLPGAGFLNFGNTCYLNSSLQALLHIPAFVNWIQNDDEHRRMCKGTLPNQTPCIICVVYITLQEHSRTSSAIRPRVLDKLKAICKHFSYGRQEDAHEFLRYLFEGMERSYLTLNNGLRLDNRTKETNPLGQIFGGYIRTEVTCVQCSSVSTTFQPSAELQLDIRHSTTLEDALMLHFKKEKLDNNDYKCEKCRRISQATKQFSLELPPLVLCLQLKRFTLYGNKIGKRIHCNKFLNMSRYLHKSRKTSGFYADNELKYRLVALVTHLGQSPNCGHYTAIAEGSNGSYYQFDDQYVHEVSSQTALNNDAYLLIYEMDRSCQPGLTSSSSNGGGINQSSSSFTNPNNKPCTVTSGAIVNGSPTPQRKFVIPFAKTNGTTSTPTTPLKTTSMMSNTDAIKSSSNSNGPGSCIDRHIIRFGIPSNSLMKSPIASPNKINILKPGVALTNSSSRLYSTTPASVASKVVVVPSKPVKLVPYDAIDNDDEMSDQEAKEETKKPTTEEKTIKIIGPQLETKRSLSPSPALTTPTKSTSPSSSTKKSNNNIFETFGVKRKLEDYLGPDTVTKSPQKKGTTRMNATSDWTVTLNNGYSSDPDRTKIHSGGGAVRARSMERVNPNKKTNKTTSTFGVLPTTAPLIPNNNSNNNSPSKKSKPVVDASFKKIDQADTVPNGEASSVNTVVQNGHGQSPKKKRKRSSSNSSSSSSSSGRGEERKKKKKEEANTSSHHNHHHKAKKAKKEKKKSAKPASSSSSSSSSDSDSSAANPDRHHKRHHKKSKKKHSSKHHESKEKKGQVNGGGRSRSTSSSTSSKNREQRDASSVDREQILRNARNPSRSPSKSIISGTGSSIDIFSPNKIDRREKTIVDWNGKESLLATAIEKEKRAHAEKSRDEYDDELDQGRVKKQRLSRSPSREDGEHTTPDGNKFQTHQDRQKLVGKWSSLLSGYGVGFKDHANNAKNFSPKGSKKPWLDKKFNHQHDSPSSSQYTNNNTYSGPRQQNRNPEHRSNNFPSSRPGYNGNNNNNRYRHHDRNQNQQSWGRNRR